MSTQSKPSTRPKAPRRTPSLALLFSIARSSPPSPSRHAATRAAQENAVATCIARYRAENPTAGEGELQRLVEETLCSGLEAAEDHAEEQYGASADSEKRVQVTPRASTVSSLA